MKTIGLLGGTGWASTISYYTQLNQLVGQQLGKHHSAKIILSSIDYHDIMLWYGKNHEKIAQTLEYELIKLIDLKPDCIIICCNTLHKYYDIIKDSLNLSIPVFHAVNLVAKHAKEKEYAHVLLLATEFTMEDGFFSHILESQGIRVTVPNKQERQCIGKIHQTLMKNIITVESKNYFRDLIERHKHLDAVVLGCTEYPLIVDPFNSALPIIDPVNLQATCAVNFAMESHIQI